MGTTRKRTEQVEIRISHGTSSDDAGTLTALRMFAFVAIYEKLC